MGSLIVVFRVLCVSRTVLTDGHVVTSNTLRKIDIGEIVIFSGDASNVADCWMILKVW